MENPVTEHIHVIATGHRKAVHATIVDHFEFVNIILEEVYFDWLNN